MTEVWDHDSKVDDTTTIEAGDSIVIADVEHPAILSASTVAKFGNLPMLKVSQLRVASGWFCLVYGLGGAGKTSLVSTLLDAQVAQPLPIAYIDLDHHTDPLYDMPEDSIDVFPIASSTRAWSALKAFFKAASDGSKFPWRTLVIDSLHETQDVNLLSITQQQVTLPEYGRSQREILTMLRLLRDFSLSAGVNVLVMCGAEPETDEMSHILRYGFALTPKLASRVRLVANNIAYIEQQVQPPYLHILHFEPSARYITKVAASPKQYALVQSEPSLGHILDVIKGTEPWAKYASQHAVESKRVNAQAKVASDST